MIYLDMDGVLADFDRGLIELCSFASRPESDEAMWQKIRTVDHYYYKLKPMPGAQQLLEVCLQCDACEILTGIPKQHRGIPTAAEDKVQWVRTVLNSDLKVNICYAEDKQNFVKQGKKDILIDDNRKNVIRWRAAGGTAILYQSAEQVIAELKLLCPK